jgi:small subunit ribosomal protein S17
MPRQLTGTVSSDRGDKTIVITVRERRTHPLYKKQYTLNTRFMAHDEKNEAKIGDLVIIEETRPISARKRFKLAQIVEKAHAAFSEADATADVAGEVIEPKPDKPEKAQPAEKTEKPIAKPVKPKAKAKKEAEEEE